MMKEIATVTVCFSCLFVSSGHNIVQTVSFKRHDRSIEKSIFHFRNSHSEMMKLCSLSHFLKKTKE